MIKRARAASRTAEFRYKIKSAHTKCKAYPFDWETGTCVEAQY